MKLTCYTHVYILSNSTYYRNKPTPPTPPKKGTVYCYKKNCLKRMYVKILFRNSNMIIKKKNTFSRFKDLEISPLFYRWILKLIRQRINLASGIWSSLFSRLAIHSPLVWQLIYYLNISTLPLINAHSLHNRHSHKLQVKYFKTIEKRNLIQSPELGGVF